MRNSVFFSFCRQTVNRPTLTLVNDLYFFNDVPKFQISPY